MDIYDFFNSPDVAEHCRNIGHSFNAMESAVMVSQSLTRTLAEKHGAYNYIISHYPDMEIPEALNHKHIKSFHKALGDVVLFEKRLLEKLTSPEPGAVYSVEIKFNGDKGNPTGSFNEEIFSTYENAVAAAVDCLKRNTESGCLDKIFSYDFLYMYISKKYLDDNKHYIDARLSRSGDVLDVYNNGVLRYDDVDEPCLLESFYIDVPVPFKAGDLVECHYYGDWADSACVVQDIIRDNPILHAKLLGKYDISDMTANVFFVRDGEVDCDHIHFYPDLRYCRRELEGRSRILKYISLFMQDKLHLCNLLQLQEYLALDEKINELKNGSDLPYFLEKIGDKLLDK